MPIISTLERQRQKDNYKNEAGQGNTARPFQNTTTKQDRPYNYSHTVIKKKITKVRL